MEIPVFTGQLDMRRTALITGATSGIGRATAHEFAKHEFLRRQESRRYIPE